jgi:methyl-accepting chemotaxis protein
MKKNGLSHIRRWLWVYVFLVVITTLATFTSVYREISAGVSSPRLAAADLNTANSQTSSVPLMSGIKVRVLLLLTAGFFTISFLSIIWLRVAARYINRPIHAIHHAVFRLAQGKLNETIAIESTDEFGQIGSSINELAANLQELLLYIWKQTGQCMTALEQLKHIPESLERECLSGLTDEHLQELTKAIHSLREMAKAYVFYDVRLDGEKALSISQPGQNASTDLTSL